MNNPYYRYPRLSGSGSNANPFAGLAPAPYVSQYSGLPVEELRQAGEVLQKRWERGAESVDAMEEVLLNLFYNTDESDREYVDQVISRFREKLGRYNDRQDYHNFSREIKKDVMDLQGSVTPAIQRKQAIDAQKAEMRKSGKFTQDELDRRWAFERGHMKGMEIDPETGRPIDASYSPHSWATPVNVRAMADELIKGIKSGAKSEETGWVRTEDGKWFNKHTQTGGYTEKQMVEMVLKGFDSDKAFDNYLQDELKIAMYQKEQAFGRPLDADEKEFLRSEIRSDLIGSAADYAGTKAANYSSSEKTDLRFEPGTRKSSGGDGNGNYIGTTSFKTHGRPSYKQNQIVVHDQDDKYSPHEVEVAKREMAVIGRQFQVDNDQGPLAPYYDMLNKYDNVQDFVDAYVKDKSSKITKTQYDRLEKLRTESVPDSIKGTTAASTWEQSRGERIDAYKKEIGYKPIEREAERIFKSYSKQVEDYSKTRTVTYDATFHADRDVMENLGQAVMQNSPNLSLKGSETDTEDSQKARVAIESGDYTFKSVADSPEGIVYVFAKSDSDVKGEEYLFMEDRSGKTLDFMMSGVNSSPTKMGFGAEGAGLVFAQTLHKNNFVAPAPGEEKLLADNLFPQGNVQQLAMGYEYKKGPSKDKPVVSGYTLLRSNDQQALIGDMEGMDSDYSAVQMYKDLYGEEVSPEQARQAPMLFTSPAQVYQVAYNLNILI